MGTSSSRTWTAEQLRAITTTGSSLLVSAAAGSGKTSVLAERCVHLVCDAKPRCTVNQLLVVTFTEAAAAEMKGRIEQALRQRLERAGDDDHLRRQFALVEHIHCSTLHSFCNRLLRQHFHRLGLDPSFRVLDGEEAVLLRMETARDLFMDCYDRDADDAFQRFIDAFGEGDDEALMQTVVQTHELLCSLVHPHGWMDRALRRIREACEKPFETTELGREYLALIAHQLDDLERDCHANIKSILRMDGFESYFAYLGDLLAMVERWKHLLHDRGYDALATAVRDVKLDRMPSVRSATPNKDVAQKLVEDVKKQCTDGPLAQSLRFTSKEWQDGLRSVCDHVKVFLDLVAEFAKRYRKDKDAIRAVDFADLERLALRLLNEGKGDQLRPTPVARVLHKQYQHVLVDEYQDINEVQDAILTLVSRECLGGKGATANLFCVGDVKQSIYRFRLAEPARFLERYAEFAGGDGLGTIIDLQANFRSRAPLLDVLNKVFERLMTEAAAEIEYDASHRLHAKATFAQADGVACFSGSPVELHLVPDQFSNHAGDDTEETPLGELERSEREAVVVARRIQELMGRHGCPRMHVIDGAKGARPLEYRDIVILLRATRYHADQYADVLRQHGIPVYNSSGGGYFDAMEVRDMLSLLRLLDNKRQDIPMAAVLRCPLSGLADPEDSLARIRLAFREAGVAFHEAVVRYAREKDDELAAKLRDFLNDLNTWRELVRERPVADLIWAIYERTGFLAFCNGLENGQQRCANLFALYERARQFGTFSRQGLYRFIRFLESLSAETDAAQAPELGEADNVVRIMSVHKSKGLEFPVVFLPELGKRINFQGCSGTIIADRHAYLGFSAIDERKRIRYPSLASTLVSSRLRRQTLAEEMRVLYVAMTRAKEHLILVGTCREAAVEGWHRAWDLHDGPLPANTILNARTMLDWLGPVAAALSGDEPPSIQIFDHPADEIANWVTDAEPVDRAEQIGQRAKLEPLEQVSPDNAVARQIIERLQSRYCHEPFCNLAASAPVSALAAHPAGSDGSTEKNLARAALGEPRFLLEEESPSAAERGAAMHLFLEHLDFARASSVELREQLEALVARKAMTRSQADALDLGAVEWFLESEPGRLLRKTAPSVRRELPVTFALPPESCGGIPSEDPLDHVMARGRIDLLLPDDRGFTLIDYKTDRVTPEHVSLRAGAYRAQLDLYRRAIERVTGKPVHTCHIVFLAARAVFTL